MKNRIKRVEKIPVYSKDGSVRRHLNVEVSLVPDDVTGEYCYTPEALMAIDKAIAADADVPLPEEIKEIRERLGKSQREMCRLLKLGDRTWTRWETGAAIPDPANRQQIRLLATGGLSVYELERSLKGQELIFWAPIRGMASDALASNASVTFGRSAYFCYKPTKRNETNEANAVVFAA